MRVKQPRPGPSAPKKAPRRRAEAPFSARLGQGEAEKASSARRRGPQTAPGLRGLGQSRASTPATAGPYSEPELHEIADSSSQSERTAAEAERELLEWKKLKFMEQRIGEDFDSLIVSVTKFGFFV